jgi:hypothetical protein
MPDPSLSEDEIEDVIAQLKTTSGAVRFYAIGHHRRVLFLPQTDVK